MFTPLVFFLKTGPFAGLLQKNAPDFAFYLYSKECITSFGQTTPTNDKFCAPVSQKDNSQCTELLNSGSRPQRSGKQAAPPILFCTEFRL